MARAATATTRYLTPDEVCERYGVSKQTLYNWRTQGIGPRATKLCGSLRYAEADLAEFERSGRGVA